MEGHEGAVGVWLVWKSRALGMGGQDLLMITADGEQATSMASGQIGLRAEQRAIDGALWLLTDTHAKDLAGEPVPVELRGTIADAIASSAVPDALTEVIGSILDRHREGRTDLATQIAAEGPGSLTEPAAATMNPLTFLVVLPGGQPVTADQWQLIAWPECPQCGGPIEVAQLQVTAAEDEVARFVPGAWHCADGHTEPGTALGKITLDTP